MPALPSPCVCLVTRREPWGEDGLVERVAAAARGGVNMVQVREKDLPGGRLLALVQRIQEAVTGRALVLVNERVDVALACGADGVHLGEEALPIDRARRLVGRGMLISRAVHTADAAASAEAAGADLLVVGTVFPTESKPGKTPEGISLLRRIGRGVSVPYLGIGGISPDNAAEVLRVGGAGVAVIGAVLDAPDPERAASALRERVEGAMRGSSPAHARKG